MKKNIQQESKRSEYCQKILALAMRESDQQGLLPGTKLADVFADSLEWLSFIQCLKKELGDIPTDEAVKAETFIELAQAYAV